MRDLTPKAAALLREARLERARRRRARANAWKPNITLLRVREMERLFSYRSGRFLPDNNAARSDIQLVAHHLANRPTAQVKHIVDWCRRWAPWMPTDEAEAIAAASLGAPRHFTADVLGALLRVTLRERISLEIRTIGSYETTKADREKMRKAKSRERSRQWRRMKAVAEGRLPRARPGRPRT